MKLLLLSLLTTLALVIAAAPPGPCAKVHIIAARQSTSWPGEGRMKDLSNLIKQQIPCSDSEALDYPAYGDIWRYRASVFAGDKAMITAISTYASRCPDSKIVLLGYSQVSTRNLRASTRSDEKQGAHIIGDILCGSVVEMSFPAVLPIHHEVGAKIVAAVSMGDPSYVPCLPYNFGTSKKKGLFARVNNTVCTQYDFIRRSYCDEGDKYCASGLWFWVHRKYMKKYKEDAMRFVLSRINASQNRSRNAE
ncbi:hypothetical protein BBP40_002036 [Aspergillus hancockii]|nr:hypothetical protein BBP40_002036 [Aspergillus hancockii]